MHKIVFYQHTITVELFFNLINGTTNCGVYFALKNEIFNGQKNGNEKKSPKSVYCNVPY
jgi:hypothetical protein